jgi:Flp pilus assembly protein TadB
MRWLVALGAVVLAAGVLALADAYGLRLFAVAVMLAGIFALSMYVRRSRKRQRRHRQWFEEG